MTFNRVRRALRVAVNRVCRSLVGDLGSSGVGRTSLVAETLEPRRLLSRATGIDVSNDQGVIHWSSVAAGGYAFAYVKATEGTTLTDARLAANVNGGVNAAMLMGVTHVAKPDVGANDAVNEANHFFQQAGGYMTAGFLRPAVVIADGAWIGKGSLSTWVEAFVDQMKTLTGVRPIIQTGTDYAEQYLSTGVASNEDLSIVNHSGAYGDAKTTGAPPTGAWAKVGEGFDFWQHSSTAAVNGINGPARVSVFRNNRIALDEHVIDQPYAAPLSLRLNFGPVALSVPEGYVNVAGAPWGMQHGRNMGWSTADATTGHRTGGNAPDERYRTHVVPNAGGVARSFEVAVPNGQYRVRVVTGSPDQHGELQRVSVEGLGAVDRTTTFDTPFASATVTVAVNDGRLTIASDLAAANTRILFADISDAALDENGVQASWNFGKDFSAAVPGYFTDIGNRHGLKSNGLTYGWRNAAGDPTYVSHLAFERHTEADQRLDTGIRTADASGAYTWEAEVPNGFYYVNLVAGDAQVASGTYGYDVESASFLRGTAAAGAGRWITAAKIVNVTDGKLTIRDAAGMTNHALAYVEITSNGARNRGSVAAPRGVAATAVGGSTVDVRWRDDSDNETSFSVERRVAGGAWAVVGNAFANAGLFTDSTAAATTAYEYRVIATKGALVSPPVASDPLTTPATGAGQAPYNPPRTAWTTGATIEAEAFDTGGEDVSYNDLSVGNAGGYYRSGNIDVGHNLTSGRYFLGWNRVGEWSEYTVNVPTAGTYVLEASVASGDSLGGKFDIKVNGTSKSSAVQIPYTGAFSAYQPVTSGTFTLAAGNNQVLRLTSVVDGASGWAVGDIDWFKLTRVSDPPTAGIEIVGTPSTTFDPSIAVTSVPQTLQLAATVRDFHPNGTNGEYSDFGHANFGYSPWTGIVRPTLGPDRTPMLSPSWPQGQYEVRDAESFSWWYHDTPGKNLTTQLAMPFELVGTAPGTPIYAFDNQSFLPINGRLFGNEDPGGVNGGFTLELHSSFTYNENFASPPVLNFTGDDDVWVFINGKLALDLGGIHPPNAGVITLDRPTVDALGLLDGGTYSFDFFFAERQIGGSTLHLETSLPIFGDYDYRAALTANDFDPDAGVTWTVDQPGGATITPVAGASPLTSQLAWTPQASDFGTTKHFKVRATDGQGNVAIREWDVVVGHGANQPPYPVGGAPMAPGVAVVGQTYNWNAAAGFSDADGDSLTFLPSGEQPLPDGMTLTASGTFNWLPTAGQLGLHQVSYTVFDGNGGQASGTFDVTVTDQPQPVTPTVTIAVNPASVDEGASPATPATFTVTLTRPDLLAGPITVPLTVSGTAEAGDYTGAVPPNLTFQPTPGVSTPQTFTFSVTPQDDTQDESNETIIVGLGSGGGYTIGTPANATATIIDDDDVMAPPSTDVDFWSDEDENGKPDNYDYFEVLERSSVSVIPTTAHYRPFALNVRPLTANALFFFTFDASKLNVYKDGARSNAIASGQAVQASDLKPAGDGTFLLFLDTDTTALLPANALMVREGAGPSAAAFAGGIQGVTSQSVNPFATLYAETFTADSIYVALMLAQDSSPIEPTVDAGSPPGTGDVGSSPNNPNGLQTSLTQVINGDGDFAYFENFFGGGREITVYKAGTRIGHAQAGDQFMRLVKQPGGDWENMDGRVHNGHVVALPGNAGRSRSITDYMRGTKNDPTVAPAARHKGAVKMFDAYSNKLNTGSFSKGDFRKGLTKIMAGLAVAGIVGMMANAAFANPLAADPTDAMDEIEKWRNGDSEEIFVKLEIDAYMRAIFQGLPDEILAVASYTIFYLLDLEEWR